MRAFPGGLLIVLLAAAPACAQVAANRPFGRATVDENWTAAEAFSPLENEGYVVREVSGGSAVFGHSLIAKDSGPVELQPPEFDDETYTPSAREFLEAQPVQYPLDNKGYEGPDSWEPPFGDESAAPPPVLDSAECLPEDPLKSLVWKDSRANVGGVIGLRDELGFLSMVFRGTLASPRYPAVWLTPQFGWHFLSGPTTPDIPSQLYDFALDLTMVYPVNEAWLLQFAVVPSLFTDGQNTSSDALRKVGRAMAFYRTSPEWQFAAGVSYLDRQDFPAIPAGGAIYTPDERTRYEILFPRPRYARRLAFDGVRERWFYIVGEIGGGSWAVERASGADDVFTYRDYRALFGFENKRKNGLNWFLESGYVFGREIEYESELGNRGFGFTALIRAGGSY